MTTQKVDAFNVVAGDTGVDYDKLIDDFGASKITDELLHEIQETIGKPLHHFLKRRLFFSHRDLSFFLNAFKKHSPVYLYTGRGPSSDSMHMGHLIPFIFTKWLQEAFNCPLVVQLTDDEKSIFKPHLTPENCHEMAISNAKDIIACGFDVNKTFIFSDIEYIGYLYPTVLQIQRCITPAMATSCFGFPPDSNTLKMSFSAIQASPSFSCAFPQIFHPSATPSATPAASPAPTPSPSPAPEEGKKAKKNKHQGQQQDAPLRLVPCLIPCAIDQDPYFRLTRDVATMLKWPKPSLIHSRFLSALQGRNTKMSASSESSAIYLNEAPDSIARKVGRMNFEERDMEKSAVMEYLTFFLEDDNLLEQCRLQLSGQLVPTPPLDIQGLLTRTLQDVVAKHQSTRAALTEEAVREFMRGRPLPCCLQKHRLYPSQRKVIRVAVDLVLSAIECDGIDTPAQARLVAMMVDLSEGLLGEAVDFSQPSVSNWFTGARPAPAEMPTRFIALFNEFHADHDLDDAAPAPVAPFAPAVQLDPAEKAKIWDVVTGVLGDTGEHQMTPEQARQVVERLRSCHLSQKRLGKMIGYDQSSVSRWLTGARQFVSLGVTFVKLFDCVLADHDAAAPRDDAAAPRDDAAAPRDDAAAPRDDAAVAVSLDPAERETIRGMITNVVFPALKCSRIDTPTRARVVAMLAEHPRSKSKLSHWPTGAHPERIIELCAWILDDSDTPSPRDDAAAPCDAAVSSNLYSQPIFRRVFCLGRRSIVFWSLFIYGAILICPVSLFLGWGIWALAGVVPAWPGVSVVLLSLSGACLLGAFLDFLHSRWRLRMLAEFLTAAGALCLGAFLLTLVLLPAPFDYTGFTAVMLVWGMVPVVAYVYLLPQGTEDFVTWARRKVLLALKRADRLAAPTPGISTSGTKDPVAAAMLLLPPACAAAPPAVDSAPSPSAAATPVGAEPPPSPLLAPGGTGRPRTTPELRVAQSIRGNPDAEEPGARQPGGVEDDDDEVPFNCLAVRREDSTLGGRAAIPSGTPNPPIGSATPSNVPAPDRLPGGDSAGRADASSSAGCGPAAPSNSSPVTAMVGSSLDRIEASLAATDERVRRARIECAKRRGLPVPLDCLLPSALAAPRRGRMSAPEMAAALGRIEATTAATEERVAAMRIEIARMRASPSRRPAPSPPLTPTGRLAADLRAALQPRTGHPWGLAGPRSRFFGLGEYERLFRVAVLFTASALVLVGYAEGVHMAAGTGQGWVTAGTLLVLDLTVVLYSSRMPAPLVTSSILLLARVLFVLGGRTYGYLALALIYLLWGGFVALTVATSYLPVRARLAGDPQALFERATGRAVLPGLLKEKDGDGDGEEVAEEDGEEEEEAEERRLRKDPEKDRTVVFARLSASPVTILVLLTGGYTALVVEAWLTRGTKTALLLAGTRWDQWEVGLLALTTTKDHIPIAEVPRTPLPTAFPCFPAIPPSPYRHLDPPPLLVAQLLVVTFQAGVVALRVQWKRRGHLCWQIVVAWTAFVGTGTLSGLLFELLTRRGPVFAIFTVGCLLATAVGRLGAILKAQDYSPPLPLPLPLTTIRPCGTDHDHGMTTSPVHGLPHSRAVSLRAQRLAGGGSFLRPSSALPGLSAEVQLVSHQNEGLALPLFFFSSSSIFRSCPPFSPRSPDLMPARPESPSHRPASPDSMARRPGTAAITSRRPGTAATLTSRRPGTASTGPALTPIQRPTTRGGARQAPCCARLPSALLLLCLAVPGLAALLSVAMGYMVGPLVGITLATCLALVLLGAFGAAMYRGRLRAGWEVPLALGLALAVLVGYCLSVWLVFLGGSTQRAGSLALLLFAVGCLLAPLLAAAFWTWHRQDWALSWRLVVLFGCAFLVYGAFCALVAVFANLWAGIGLGIAGAVLLYCLAVAMRYFHLGGYIEPVWLWVLFAVDILAVLGGIPVGILVDAFGGFCMGMGALVAGLLLLALVEAWARMGGLFFGRAVFPVHEHDPRTAQTTSRSAGIAATYGALLVSFLWGLVSIFWMPTPLWAAVLWVSCVVIVLQAVTLALLKRPFDDFLQLREFVAASAVGRVYLEHKVGFCPPPCKAHHLALPSPRQALAATERATEAEQAATASMWGLAKKVVSHGCDRPSQRLDHTTLLEELPLRRAAIGHNARGVVALTEAQFTEQLYEVAAMQGAIGECFTREAHFLAHFKALLEREAAAARDLQASILAEFTRAMAKQGRDFSAVLGAAGSPSTEAVEEARAARAEYIRELAVFLYDRAAREQQERAAADEHEAERRRLEALREAAGEDEELGEEQEQQWQAEHAGTGQKYDDAEFPPGPAALGSAEFAGSFTQGPNPIPPDEAGQIPWCRAAQLCPPADPSDPDQGLAPPRLFAPLPDGRPLQEGAICDEVRQGALGDCFLIAALSTLARHPEWRRGLFLTTDEDLAQGACVVRLYRPLSLTRLEVTVDDWLPCTAWPSPTDPEALVRGPAFGSSGTPGEVDRPPADFWVSLVEKAVAKTALLGGPERRGYQSIHGGQTRLAFQVLTGAPCADLRLSEYRRNPGRSLPHPRGPLRVQDCLPHARSFSGTPGARGGDRYPMCAGSNLNEASDAAGRLDAAQTNGISLVRRLQFLPSLSGYRCRQTTTCRTRAHRHTPPLTCLDHPARADGKFIMSLVDFVKHFASFVICKLPPRGPAWHTASMDGMWTAPFDEATRRCLEAPQFLLKVTRPTLVSLRLHQHTTAAFPSQAARSPGCRAPRVPNGRPPGLPTMSICPGRPHALGGPVLPAPQESALPELMFTLEINANYRVAAWPMQQDADGAATP
ncbi:putative Tryptophan--tRNA ligase [Paratrimastix pyriformis]|uniref:tryptophan--tRNA ligase n=1 Tax=Paratrimastix pyriformis TaxID=342808 RepID=A0ABQ8UH60_9EUKA|nr:putative Tryptophan--tRNA ligase [Paratrimastix pyriformis]